MYRTTTANHRLGRDEPHRDLSAEVFSALRELFFSSDGIPIPYSLRPKENVQDDPLDELVVNRLSQHFHTNELDIGVVRSPGPLISPDFLVFRPSLVNDNTYAAPAADPSTLLAVEVKKLERTPSGKVARASGMDYNTTPPCGTVRVYASDGTPLTVPSSYLFVCQESRHDRTFAITALTLCDGNALNDDFELYLSIVGQRNKEIGLGTYGDGVNRLRPMLIFSNPLGSNLFNHATMLIHERHDLANRFGNLQLAGAFSRSPKNDSLAERVFHCYRDSRDTMEADVFHVRDPFPVPVRSTVTQRRGRFLLPWSLKGSKPGI